MLERQITGHSIFSCVFFYLFSECCVFLYSVKHAWAGCVLISYLFHLLPLDLTLCSLCFLMLNKAASVLCDDSIYCVCSWTLHMLCDLCLSDSLYFFVKHFNKIIFTTDCVVLDFFVTAAGTKTGVVINIHIIIKKL